jgi:hypothetical protein
MDVLYIRRSLAWIHAIVFGHVSEFQHTGQDESASCQNVYKELHISSLAHAVRGEVGVAGEISLEAEWASSRLVEVANSVQLSI